MTRHWMHLLIVGMALAVPRVALSYRYQGTDVALEFRHRPHGYAGAELRGLVIVNDSYPASGFLGTGGGGAVFGGMRINPYLAVEGRTAFTFHDEAFATTGGTVTTLDSVSLITLSVDLKLYLPTRGRVEPFFQLGGGYALVGANYISTGYDTTFTGGPCLRAGGGVQVYLGAWVSLGLHLLYEGFVLGDPPAIAGIATRSNFVSALAFGGFTQFHF